MLTYRAVACSTCATGTATSRAAASARRAAAAATAAATAAAAAAGAAAACALVSCPPGCTASQTGTWTATGQRWVAVQDQQPVRVVEGGLGPGAAAQLRCPGCAPPVMPPALLVLCVLTCACTSQVEEGCRRIQQLLESGAFSAAPGAADGHASAAHGSGGGAEAARTSGGGGGGGGKGSTVVPWSQLFELLCDEHLLEQRPEALPQTGYGDAFEAHVSGIFVRVSSGVARVPRLGLAVRGGQAGRVVLPQAGHGSAVEVRLCGTLVCACAALHVGGTCKPWTGACRVLPALSPSLSLPTHLWHPPRPRSL